MTGVDDAKFPYNIVPCRLVAAMRAAGKMQLVPAKLANPYHLGQVQVMPGSCSSLLHAPLA